MKKIHWDFVLPIVFFALLGFCVWWLDSWWPLIFLAGGFTIRFPECEKEKES